MNAVDMESTTSKIPPFSHPYDPPSFVLRRSRHAPRGIAGKVVALCRRALRLSRLGARPVDRGKLFASTFLLQVAAKTGRRAQHRVDLTIRAFGRTGRCTISDFSHLLLLEAIFLDGDYAIDPRSEPSVIVDLGSNIGLSILYFRLRFPDARIIGIEPDPAAFALLERNTGRLPGVTVRHAAVGEHDGTATFWSAPGADASSLEHTHDAQRPVTVPVATLDSMLADAGIRQVDVLKLVVEGSEFAALRSLTDLDRIQAITGEILLLDHADRSEAALRTLLADFDVSLHEDKGDGFWQFHAHRTGG
jgi:FkbM family methyltransferase